MVYFLVSFSPNSIFLLDYLCITSTFFLTPMTSFLFYTFLEMWNSYLLWDHRVKTIGLWEIKEIMARLSLIFGGEYVCGDTGSKVGFRSEIRVLCYSKIPYFMAVSSSFCCWSKKCDSEGYGGHKSCCRFGFWALIIIYIHNTEYMFILLYCSLLQPY